MSMAYHPLRIAKIDQETPDARSFVLEVPEALADKFEPEKYHDSFEENVKALIKARLEGADVAPVEKPKKLAPVVDLMAALKESLANMPKKPPQPATAEAESKAKETPKPGKSRRKTAA